MRKPVKFENIAVGDRLCLDRYPYVPLCIVACSDGTGVTLRRLRPPHTTIEISRSEFDRAGYIYLLDLAPCLWQFLPSPEEEGG